MWIRVAHYYRIIAQEYSTELYYGIVFHGLRLRNYIMESDYGVILRNHITESYYGLILRNGIAELHDRISLRSDIAELYYDRKNDHISTNVQRQKLSIRASESFRYNASPQRPTGQE